ncbi:MAG: hypothetical protein GTN60_12280 [Pseudomonas stutzeri]|nr:hypothetical protein [Stutzerimonas stutzeri]NIM53181.1 hypothetical protein [Stutzerimonas stutzeri]NIM87501.1 hypothetical protein [Stutzerimonas stutzeri]NIN82193.1 hypothetical protein [Stutzerimonas stutzeri]NIP01436.1 hypothetical protein [Stutzerimonas stutzeri]
MNDDQMRLSDLLPEYARYNKLTPQEAAHALHELFEELYIKHSETLENRLSLNSIFWVEGAKSSERKARPYRLNFQLFSKYFYDIFNSSPKIENGLINCYSEASEQFKNIPASVIYFSRTNLGEWIQTVSTEPLGFLFNEASEKNSCKPSKEEIKAFQGKELVSIRGLARGLVEIIIEVDRAHRGLSKKLDPDAILLAGSELDLELKASKWHEILATLAEAAEVEDFRSNRRTLEKYVGE